MRIVVGLIAAASALAACSSSGGAPSTPLPTTPTVGLTHLPSFAAGSSENATFTFSTPPASSSSSSAPSSAPSSSSSAPAVTIQPAPSTPLSQTTVKSSDGKRTYVIKIWQKVTSGADCAEDAYGTPVIQYLTAHPCTGLTRILATTVVNGRPVGFAQSSLGFVGNAPQVYSTAGNFATLVNANGTGNIDDLLREGYRLPDGPSSVPQPDAFDVESQDSGVTIVDAFYLDGSTPENSPALVKMAKDIYLQF